MCWSLLMQTVTSVQLCNHVYCHSNPLQSHLVRNWGSRNRRRQMQEAKQSPRFFPIFLQNISSFPTPATIWLRHLGLSVLLHGYNLHLTVWDLGHTVRCRLQKWEVHGKLAVPVRGSTLDEHAKYCSIHNSGPLNRFFSRVGIIKGQKNISTVHIFSFGLFPQHGVTSWGFVDFTGWRSLDERPGDGRPQSVPCKVSRVKCSG